MGLYDSAQQNAPGQTAPKPVYKGLMGGDYDSLQNSLTVGGRQAAENGYNTGTKNLNDTMSGKGLYGSSIMQQQQQQGLDREYMRALAGNEASAAATRYGMQQADNKTAYEGAMQGYGIDTQANTAANNLSGQIRMSTADNVAKNYGVDQGLLGQKYGYDAQAARDKYSTDTQARSSVYHDDSQARIAAASNANNLTSMQAQIAAAKAAGNNALAASLTATAVGLYGKNFDSINSAIGSGYNALSGGFTNWLNSSQSAPTVDEGWSQGMIDYWNS